MRSRLFTCISSKILYLGWRAIGVLCIAHFYPLQVRPFSGSTHKDVSVLQGSLVLFFLRNERLMSPYLVRPALGDKRHAAHMSGIWWLSDQTESPAVSRVECGFSATSYPEICSARQTAPDPGARCSRCVPPSAIGSDTSTGLLCLPLVTLPLIHKP
jgi:hypothetical protein